MRERKRRRQRARYLNRLSTRFLSWRAPFMPNEGGRCGAGGVKSFNVKTQRRKDKVLRQACGCVALIAGLHGPIFHLPAR
jgi:hypothetical protein